TNVVPPADRPVDRSEPHAGTRLAVRLLLRLIFPGGHRHSETYHLGIDAAFSVAAAGQQTLIPVPSRCLALHPGGGNEAFQRQPRLVSASPVPAVVGLAHLPRLGGVDTLEPQPLDAGGQRIAIDRRERPVDG